MKDSASSKWEQTKYQAKDKMGKKLKKIPLTYAITNTQKQNNKNRSSKRHCQRRYESIWSICKTNSR
jgi:hypothetical protein